MWIIAEGPTVAGKTTLINRLGMHKQISDDIQLVHMDRPEKHERRWVLKEYVNQWQRRRSTRDDLIADRWHWGEATYAPVYRPETDTDGFGLLGKAGWRWTEMFLASRGATIGMVTANNHTLAQRLEERGDDHVSNDEDLFRVANLYEIARRESINVAAIHDTSPEETDEQKYTTFVDSLVEEAQRRQEAAHRVTDRWARYTGTLTPQILLVGDQRNQGKDNQYSGETILPFMPIAGNSGEYLLNALPDMTWRTVGMVNAGEVLHIDELHEALGKPEIIALGDAAHKHLTTKYNFGDGVVMKVPHPQYVRRFFHDRQSEYGRSIVELANTGETRSRWTQLVK